MDNKTKIKIGIGLLLGIVLFSSFKKPKKKSSSIEFGELEKAKSADADFLVLIKKGAVVKPITLTATEMKMAQDVTWDGFDTNELPNRVKVRDGSGNYFYAYAADFKLL